MTRVCANPARRMLRGGLYNPTSPRPGQLQNALNMKLYKDVLIV